MDEIVPKSVSQQGNQRSLSRVLRRFSGILHHMEDMHAFADGLESLLKEFPDLEKACIQQFEDTVSPGSLTDQFKNRQLVIPLKGENQVKGVIKIPDNRRGKKMGAGDLHLLSSLAGVVGILLEKSASFQSSSHQNSVISHLLDLMPLGVVCVSADGREFIFNQPARQFLRLNEKGESPHLEIILKENQRESGSYHLKVDHSLYYARLLKYPPKKEATEYWITLLVDLTQERDRIHEFLVRETYRCKWQNTPLSLLFMQAPKAEDKLLERIPSMETALGAQGVVGPIDAQSVAFIVPGLNPIDLKNWIRQHQDLLPIVEIHIGHAGLSPKIENGIEILEKAVAAAEDRHSFLKRKILLVDDYAPINDTIEMVLAGDYHILKTTSCLEADFLLQGGDIDGLIVERDLSDGQKGEDLARLGMKLNPSFQTILTSADLPSMEDRQAAGPGIHFLQKPFNANDLTEIVSSAWPAVPQ